MATFQLEIKFPARRGCSVTRRRRNEISAKSPSQKPQQQPEAQTRVLIKPLKPPRLLPLKQWIFSKPHMGPGKFIRALNFNYFPLSPRPRCSAPLPHNQNFRFWETQVFSPPRIQSPALTKYIVCSAAQLLLSSCLWFSDETWYFSSVSNKISERLTSISLTWQGTGKMLSTVSTLHKQFGMFKT